MPPNALDRPAPTQQEINTVVEAVARDMERQFEKAFLKPLQIRVTIRSLLLRALECRLQTIDRVASSVTGSMKKLLGNILVEQNRAREKSNAHDSDVDHVRFDDRPSKKPFSITDMTPGRLDKPTPEEQALFLMRRRQKRAS